MAPIDRLPIALLTAVLLTAGCSGGSGDGGPDTTESEDTGATSQDTGPDDTTEGSMDTGPEQMDTASDEDTAGGGGDATSDASDTSADGADGTSTTDLTYYADVKPIIDGRCVGCHTDGGIAPFPLTTYDEVNSLKSAVKDAVSNQIMPPYLAGDECTEYKHDTSLTDDQIATVVDWIDGGAPEGDPDNAGDPLPDKRAGLSRIDREVEMPTEYTPKKEPDDYRCFPIEWKGDETQYVTGFGVEPGRDEIVHHVIAYLAGPGLSDEVQQKVDSEEGPGYTCFGGPGVGNTGSATNSVEWLGAWAPGGDGMDFPDGTGIKIEPGSQIILQVHYNTLTADPAADRTKVLTTVDDEVETEAQFVPFANPQWLNNKQSMLIPAGSDSVSHSFSYDIASVVGSSLKIYDVFFHMHQLGKSGRMWIDKENGNSDCLLNIPRWDFNWQRGYRLKQPRTLEEGDELGIECEWDNSKSNQPVIDGERQSPTDVTWGEGTQDEMCLGVLYVTAN